MIFKGTGNGQANKARDSRDHFMYACSDPDLWQPRVCGRGWSAGLVTDGLGRAAFLADLLSWNADACTHAQNGPSEPSRSWVWVWCHCLTILPMVVLWVPVDGFFSTKS
jgi:hypothetical protein